jgi:hypothetical protein
MSGINLSLPVDIPWKLLATSQDMMDVTLGGATFPPKWRSSVAIFTYDPEPEPGDTSDRRVTYVKVACTITGYQTNTVKRKLVDFGALSVDAVNALEDELNRYYACYGALLQVSVLPSAQADMARLSRYPIIADVEPKRRDLYEVVTDTGETLSGSSNRAAVNKGFTSSFNTESGYGLSGTGSYGPGGQGSGAGGSVTGSLSGKTSSGTQDQTITQVDYAREKRETESHVTSLTQMYNLLQAYHVGTNRVVFLLLPRPHLVEQVEKRTFIDGPREIEGIQEFFFIVSRPRDAAGICIEAVLETGHLDLNPAEAEELTSKTVPFSFDFQAPRTIQHGGGIGDDSTSGSVDLAKSYTPPAGWEVDMTKSSGGYVVLSTEGTAAYKVESSAQGVTVTGTVVTKYTDVMWGDNFYTYQDVKGELTVFIKKKASTTTGEVKSTFFTTARSLVACSEGDMTPPPQSDWIAFEAPVHVDPRMSATNVAASTRMRLSNELARRVGTTLLESLQARPRYKPQAVSFNQSQFVMDRIVAAVRRRTNPAGHGATHPLRRDLAETDVHKTTVSRLVTVLGDAPVVEDLLRAPVSRVAEAAADESLEKALGLKWKALGFGPKTLPK